MGKVVNGRVGVPHLPQLEHRILLLQHVPLTRAHSRRLPLSVSRAARRVSAMSDVRSLCYVRFFVVGPRKPQKHEDWRGERVLGSTEGPGNGSLGYCREEEKSGWLFGWEKRVVEVQSGEGGRVNTITRRTTPLGGTDTVSSRVSRTITHTKYGCNSTLRARAVVWEGDAFRGSWYQVGWAADYSSTVNLADVSFVSSVFWIS